MTSTVICWLEELDENHVGVAGGKGMNLGRLLRLGLPVPRGFVITTEAYRAFIAANSLADADPEELRLRIPAAPIPAGIIVPILAAYEQLGGNAVAVRSSGTAEDLAIASFAGQHDTFLNVAGPESLLDAVRSCWASLWSSRAVAYRRQHGWDDRDLALAVVVQEMVPAEWAGVIFTADPVSGRRDRLIVEAVPGLGEALVSGQVSGHHYVVEKTGRHVLEGDAVLPRDILDEVARLGVRIEALVGQPQDIEWAYAGGRSAILQSRPLTALPVEVRPSATDGGRRFSRFQRGMAMALLDHMPLPPYPFDYSLFFRPGMQRALEALGWLGFTLPPIEDILVTLGEGVVQAVPPAIRPTFRALTLPAKLVMALRASPQRWADECQRSLVAEAQRIDAEDLPALSDQDLLDRIEMLRCLQVDLLVRRFGHVLPGLLISEGLPRLLRLAVGQRASSLQADLLAAVPCVTTEANRELGRLARLIRGSEELRQVFLDESPDRVAARLRDSDAGRALLTEVDGFLRQYGYRESAMPAAALPSWRDDPPIVFGLLKGLVSSEQGSSVLDVDGAGRAERARREVRASLSGRWFGLKEHLLLPLVLKATDATRSFIAFREDSHFHLFLPFPVIRHLALELGRRLVERGVLGETGDVFFLEIEEIKLLGPMEDVREKVQRRKETRQLVAGRYTAVPVELLVQTTQNGEVRGAPASPGRVVGRVRIIRDEREFWRLRPGEVLVALYTNPTWTPLFALAGAVVVDAGGTASHAAIVAREYGIPAVMGTGDGTRRLRDGQRVVVDGDRGVVVPLDEDGG